MQIQQTNDDMLTAVLYELSVPMNYVVPLSPQSITTLAQRMNILELDVDVGQWPNLQTWRFQPIKNGPSQNKMPANLNVLTWGSDRKSNLEVLT